MFCGCLSGLDESCIFDEKAHTTAELKVAGLLSRNNGPGHKCCLVFVGSTELCKNIKIFAKKKNQKSTKVIEMTCFLKDIFY